MQKFCGRVAIVGRPNVGKSSLLNFVLDTDLCIVNRKAQTTRHKIVGIATDGAYQIVFLDTPGIHQKGRRMLNKACLKILSDKHHLSLCQQFYALSSAPCG